MTGYLTMTVVVASRVLPPAVIQVRRKVVSVVMGSVSATPLFLGLFAFCAVKSGWLELEMTHPFSFILAVTHPMLALSPDSTDFGFATRTMAGFATCTVHDAFDEIPLLMQVNPKFTVRVAVGGAASVVVAEPEIASLVENPLPTLFPTEHPHEMASVIPTSATSGWQESCAVG